MQWADRMGEKVWKVHWWRWLMTAAALLVGFFARSLLWQLTVQLLSGLLIAAAALPIMRQFEKKCGLGMSAALSLLVLGGMLALVSLVLLPMLIRQGRQLLALVPQISDNLVGWVGQGEAWLMQNGLPVQDFIRRQLAAGGEMMLGNAVPALFDWMQQKAGGLGRWMLAPVLGFYFLRDRRTISEWLLLLVPVEKRRMSVRLFREARRETLGFLRGQLMVSLAVGALTAVGLLLCGIPSWLLLGIVMGVMELIPYVGPFIGGTVVVLFSLQAGSGRMLWALAVVLLVQQLEGSWLSPQMMSDATRMHPIAVLLCVMAGGAAGGIGGILFSVPLFLCLRAAFRVYAQHQKWRRCAAEIKDMKER